jgi:alpha/beta superfamily hydrolase
MPTEFLHEIAGPVGPLEALLDLPEGRPRAAVVFAHPHPLQGGTMHTKTVYQAAKALARIGCAVLRFNFRGVGRSAGAFDAGSGEMDDFRAGLDFMASRYPERALWAAGFSFGSFIALSVGAADPRVTLLLGIAPPVDRYGFEPLLTSAKPKFFIHGERDELISIKEMRRFYARLPEPKELVEIDGASHLFEGRTSEVGDAVVDLLEDWNGFVSKDTTETKAAKNTKEPL